jgi:hypothetical protein
MEPLNLAMVCPELHDQARKAIADRDALGFLISAGSERQYEMLVCNIRALREADIFEAALFTAYIMAKWGFTGRPTSHVRQLFALADRARLFACGDAIPDPLPSFIYRGIAGEHRRASGFSWTSSLEVACWFAARFNLEAPQVRLRPISRRGIYFYTNARHEFEYVCSPSAGHAMGLTPAAIKEHARRYEEEKNARNTT